MEIYITLLFYFFTKTKCKFLVEEIKIYHTLSIAFTVNAVNEAKTLDSQLKQFWELHNILIKGNEKSVNA